MSNQITPFPELHSEEVSEIINNPPNWLTRNGIIIFLTIGFIFLATSYLVRYPDVVLAPVTITSKNAPRIVVTRSEGRLSRLLVTDGDHVKKNELIAIVETTASPEQVVDLEKELKIMVTEIEREGWDVLLQHNLSHFDRLGEIQKDYHVFFEEFTSLKNFLTGGISQEKERLLMQDENNLAQLEENMEAQLDLRENDLELARQEFAMQEVLFQSQAISRLEYKRELAKLNTREIPIRTLKGSLIQNRMAKANKKKELLELRSTVDEHKSNFISSLRSLESSVGNWKRTYLVNAPVSGKVDFIVPVMEQQYLTNGEPLMAIEPQRSKLTAIVAIPQSNLGKLSQGQNVRIKLDGFPHREFGTVQGRLSSISTVVGKDSLFWAYVELPKGLTSSFNIDLTYKNGLKGVAEIITADKRLIERLFESVATGTRW